MGQFRVAIIFFNYIDVGTYFTRNLLSNNETVFFLKKKNLYKKLINNNQQNFFYNGIMRVFKLIKLRHEFPSITFYR